MIYIDQPIGSGFSFTGSDNGYSNSITDAADNLYALLSQFYKLFPEFLSKEFFIFGESYAGKYIPPFGYKILTRNNDSSESLKVPLKGVMILDGYVDPYSQTRYAEFFYEIGMFDEQQKDYAIEAYEKKIQQRIDSNDFDGCFELLDDYILGLLTPYPTYYTNITGLRNFRNFAKIEPLNAANHDYSYDYLNLPQVKRAIHAGINNSFGVNEKLVNELLKSDFCRSVRHELEVLMQSAEVFLGSGQLDVIVAVTTTRNMLEYLNSTVWTSKDDFLESPTEPWMFNGRVGAYLKKHEGIYHMTFRNAGHTIRDDQPEAAHEAFLQFIFGNL